jgi:peptide/nickel transport system permease protein
MTQLLNAVRRAEVSVSDVPAKAPAEPAAAAREAKPAYKGQSYWSNVGKRLRRDPTTVVCALVVLAIVLVAVFAPFIAPMDPYKAKMLGRLAPIGTPGHPLGTDELGRDMLSRLIYGGRISLMMGLAPVGIALVLGGLLGLIAGYAGGRINMMIMRFMDVFYAFPSIMLAIAISGALGAGIRNGMIALILVLIPSITRVTESVTTQVRSYDFVDAARASGASTFRIILTHVLSNVMGPVFIFATSLVSVSIIIASGLSFLGLGVAPPEADWGLMLSTLRQSIYINPVLCALPGVMIFVTSLCFNLMSDGLRSAMDVRL